jgi:BirA family biotin operon repressor/biotin-[acetyl-CoA-carboxylase] ligase
VPVTDADAAHPPRERRPLDDARVPGWRVEHLAATGSTNAVAAERAEPGLVVVTDHQTAGRGRLDRGWETPAGAALTFSAVVDPGVPDARWPWLPLLTGLAVAEAVRRATGIGATLKWPNDVLVGDRKLAGILVERVGPSDRPVAVIGVGVNVHQTELPVEGATSLALEGSAVDRADLLEAVLERLAAELADWRSAGGEPGRLHAAYLRACSTVGREVSVQLPGDRTVTGLAETVDPVGRLVVREPGGERVAVGAGDVVHVRAAG